MKTIYILGIILLFCSCSKDVHIEKNRTHSDQLEMDELDFYKDFSTSIGEGL